jgi:hypothetical protein
MPGLVAIRALQHAAGNTAVARALAVQREFDLREYTDHTPANPYTHIHFRFDTTTLPGYPHEHLHITVSVGGGNPKVHYYYDGWTSTWRRPGPGGNPLGGSLAAVQGEAIRWAEQKAKGYGTHFRPPTAPTSKDNPNAQFVELGSLTPQELEKQARQKAQQDKVDELRRKKAETARLKREAEQAKQAAARQAKLEREAKAKAEREAKEAERKAYEAHIAELAFCFELAFDLSPDVAVVRVKELVAKGERQAAAPMSEAAMEMYG